MAKSSQSHKHYYMYIHFKKYGGNVMGKSYGMILYLVPSIKGIPLGLKRNFFSVMHGPINQNPQGNLFL